MAKNWLSDEQVEQEIERLRNSEFVALARQETRIRMKRRQYLYCLRNLEKKGIALAAAGWSPALLDELGRDGEEIFDE